MVVVGGKALCVLGELGRGLRSCAMLGGAWQVAEIRSRIDGMEGGLGAFVGQVSQLGFKCIHKDKRSKMFLVLEFALTGPGSAPWSGALTADERDALTIAPKPCLYKRR